MTKEGLGNMTKLFGTNGIRGVVNKDMTCELALDIGKAWGTYLHRFSSKPHVVIGTDARLSNQMLKTSVIGGLLSTGCNVMDIGLVPTPALQYVVKKKHFDSGIVITASHNPPEFNGIKGIDGDGTEFSKVTEEKIESIFFNRDFKLANWSNVGSFSTWDGAVELYIRDILAQVDKEKIKKKQFHVVLDCGSGAGSVVTPRLLKKLGCDVTELYCEPDGRFPGHASEPVPENLEELMKTVPKVRADFGVAQDGDGDRAIFIDEHGGYVWGDRTLALMAKYIIGESNGGVVVTPVSTSSCLDDVVKANNGEIIRTKVGSPVVARVMKERNAVFGGEENGGLIFPTFQYCRDSAMTIVKMLELLAKENRSLGELLKEIPRYTVFKTKIHCIDEKKTVALTALLTRLKDDEEIISLDTTDGVKLYTEKGWVLVRPSGTEPIYRIYGEAKKAHDAKYLVDKYKKIIEEIIESV